MPAMADQSSFDKLASHIPVEALEDELDADRRRLKSMRDRYEEIRSDLEDLNETIQRRERLL